MIDCPRCGFSQPTDQFCANCGVNMATFTPKPKPITQRIFSNHYVVVALIVFILGSVVYYLQSKSTGSDLVAENTITRDEAFEQQRQKELQQAEDERRQRLAQKKLEQFKDKRKKSSGAATEQASMAAAAGAGPASTNTSGTAQLPKKLQVRFFETPVAELDTIFSGARVVVESPTLRSVIVANTSSLQNSLKNSKSLGSAKTWDLVPGQTMTVNYNNFGDSPKAVNYELNLEAILNRVTADTVSFQFLGGLFFGIEEESPPPIELPAETYQLPTKGAVVIVGFIPHRLAPEDTPAEALQAPLNIVLSDEFREGLSEFLMVIQAQ